MLMMAFKNFLHLHIFYILYFGLGQNHPTWEQVHRTKTASGECVNFVLIEKTNTSDYSWIVSLVPTKRTKREEMWNIKFNVWSCP